MKNNVIYLKDALYKEFRAGDVRHSQADISKAQKYLGYSPEHNIFSGINEAMPWYIAFNKVS